MNEYTEVSLIENDEKKWLDPSGECVLVGID